MVEYVSQQVNQKTPNIIKAHHYLVVNYLHLLSSKHQHTIEDHHSQISQEVLEQAEKPQRSRYQVRPILNNLTQSVVFNPSASYQPPQEKKAISFPSISKLDFQRLAKRTIRFSSIDSAGSNQL